MSRFGFFTFRPITIVVRVLEDIVEWTLPRATASAAPAWSDDRVRFSQRLMEEVRRSGRRIGELHFLLTFMRTEEGLPQRAFSELGVTPEQVED